MASNMEVLDHHVCKLRNVCKKILNFHNYGRSSNALTSKTALDKRKFNNIGLYSVNFGHMNIKVP